MNKEVTNGQTVGKTGGIKGIGGTRGGGGKIWIDSTSTATREEEGGGIFKGEERGRGGGTNVNVLRFPS